VLDDVRWVAPGPGLPTGLNIGASNNNVSIARHAGALFMAWRTAPTHFASAETEMHLVRSRDDGRTWDWAHTIAMGTDVREPLFYAVDDTLFFSWFEGGTNSLAFEPKQPWRMQRTEDGRWTEPVQWGEEAEVPWEVVAHEGKLFLTSYLGNHYDLGQPGDVSLRFQVSTDGVHWAPVGEEAEVYRGGASEAAFAFDGDGVLWAVLRNEDGDHTGFGSLLCRAEPGALSEWDCPDESDPERYDSPRMFLHDGEVYMIARRDIGGPYDQADPDLQFDERQLYNLAAYSGRPKTTALYWIDRDTREVVAMMDLPGAGDTAFPSIAWEAPHTFRIANYSSPTDDPDRTWFEGQLSDAGTGIYTALLRFERR
jgi:hypothetical protein